MNAAPSVTASSTWAGFYLGGNIGLAIGRNPARAANNLPTSPPDLSDQFHLSPFGAVGGGQIGYNWQPGQNWLFGIEADLQASGQEDARACVDGCVVRPPMFISQQENLTQRLRWFGTLRARAGWTSGAVLYYATGGFAYGNVATDMNVLYSGDGRSSTAVGSFSQNKLGWTIGGGIETQLAGNWSGKVEYLYMDLGSVSGRTRLTGDLITPPAGGGFFEFSNAVRNHVVRVGLNYKLGDPVAAPMARAVRMDNARPPIGLTWAGLYLGGNVGLGIARNPATHTRSAPVLGFDVLLDDQKIHLSPFGIVAGGQVGYNWRVAPNWLLGAEADLQASGQRDAACLSCNVTTDRALSLTQQISQTISWFGTVRGRVGWTSGAALYYATAGLAHGSVSMDYLRTRNTTVDVGEVSANKTGWTVGGGVEAQLAGRWTGKLEYLYVDLGSVSIDFVTSGGTTGSVTSRVQNHVARVGLNYHFRER